MKYIWIAIGTLCLALGTVGIIIPILPTVPFYLATLFCYSKRSERLHGWFIGTSLYKNHLESFAQKRGMTMKTKLSIVVTVTLVMGFGFFMMKSAPVGRIILAAVWGLHLIYFFFRVKTIPE